MIDERKLERAMNFLAETDASFAEEKASLRRSEILCKRVRARVYLTTEGTVATRDALSQTHPDTVAADDEYVAGVKAFETLHARRQRAELIVEVWRSLEASRRRA
jgi:hypothetical protein